MKTIYLDYNATTPIDPGVSEAMLPYLYEHFGNPSSSHEYGVTTKKAVEDARNKVAELLQCSSEEVIFTSSGSEANNYAIKGVAAAYRHIGNHIITSQIEHLAVIEVCRYLEEIGFDVTYLSVDEYGIIDFQEFEKSIRPSTILISIMHANNEVGTIEPIEKIAEIAKQHSILLHSDCAQSIGKIPVNINELKVDLLSVAGHKVYAPKGIGALYIKTGVKVEKFIHGADHEMNRRAGTENVLEIVGLGKACELITQNLPKYQDHQKLMRDLLENRLKKEFPNCRINGHPEKRLPNTLSISFPNLEANTILSELKGVAASAGAACHSDRIDVSHVLAAMRLPEEFAMGTIRLSVGRYTTEQEIENTVTEFKNVINRLQPSTFVQPIEINDGKVKLTQFTHGLGCACKLRPQLLEEVIKKLPKPNDSNIIVGTDSVDDAAVYLINKETAIIQTIDFFTPIVDEPFQFGAIAAANSLSDIYAMGGTPLFALNVVGFPSNRLPIKILDEILTGAQSVADKAGVSIIGGHTVDDTEPKFGLAVTGIIHPNRVIKNSTAKPGDTLILTKPLGTGILSTALKQGLLNSQLKSILENTMVTLNKSAAEVMQKIGVSSCTDVTGFGLIGHLLEMMNGSNTSALIQNQNVPFLPEVASLATGGIIPGGTKDNYNFTSPFVEYANSISNVKRLMLNDAQTSGGLLISVSKVKSDMLLDQLISKGIKESKIIGEVIPNQEPRIKVI